MAVLLALVCAAGYGVSDFSAGLASRRYAAEPASAIIIAVEVLGSLVAVALFPGHGPAFAAIAWGALSGVGGGIGALCLYRGLAAGAMTVVGTVSGVLAAAVPVIVGLALGDHLSLTQALGIVIAVPAIAIVSQESHPEHRAGARSGVVYGALAGLGFALLFIGLDRAGTRSGAWPVLSGQVVALCVVARAALRGLPGAGRPPRRALALAVVAGLLGACAVVAFLAASGRGELAVVAVIASLYPAFTVLLARIVLAERWSRVQATGLLVAAASVALVSVT